MKREDLYHEDWSLTGGFVSITAFTLLLLSLTAIRTALWLIGKSFGGIKLLLTSSEGERLSTVHAL